MGTLPQPAFSRYDRIAPVIRRNPPGAGENGRVALALSEIWFLRTMLGVSLVAWLALVLAELGSFGLEVLLALAVTGALIGVLAGNVRPSGTVRPRIDRSALAAAVGFGTVLLAGAVLYLPPYEAVVSGGDGSVYINFGRKIAETGRLEFEDDLVSRLPAGVRREVFEDPSSNPGVSGRHPRFPGGLRIPDIDDPSVTAGFSPLFPVLTALFHEVGSLRGAFFVAPFFAVLSMGGLFLLAAHVGGPWTGGLTAALTLALFPQTWFARFPVPEMVAQCLVMSGLLAWLVALRDDSPRWAIAAGWFLGLAGFAKVDLNVLLAVSLAAYCAWQALARRAQRGTYLAHLLIPFGLVFLHNVLHYLAFASHYRPYVVRLMRTSVLGELFWPSGSAGVAAGLLLLALTAAAGTALARRCRPPVVRKACGVVLVVLLALYAYNYVATRSGRLIETVDWLSWYVSWPVLLLAVPGLATLLGRGCAVRARSPEGPVLLFAVFAVVALQYLYDPLESGVHIWSMRRFVPVVLPLLMLGAALGLAAGLRRLPARYRAGVALALALVLVDLVARPALALVREPLWKGAVAETERMARLFPEDAVVLMGRELGLSHIPTSLAYLHDLDTVLVQNGDPRSSRMGEAVDIWLAAGRPVFFVFSDWDYFSFFAPALELDFVERTNFDVLLPVRTRSRAPTDTVEVSAGFDVFRVGRNDAARTAVDVGDPTQDVLYTLRGFHLPARRGRSEETYRWTGAEASLVLPHGGGVELTVAGSRPDGVPPAELSVWADEQVLLEARVLSGALETLSLDVPDGSGPVVLRMESTVFQPSELGVSDDPRELGVRVYRVDFGVSGARAPVADRERAETGS